MSTIVGIASPLGASLSGAPLSSTAFFLLSKFTGALLTPGMLLFLALLGALLLRRRRPRLAQALLIGVTLVLGLLNLAPLSAWTLGPLEQRFPVPELPAQVDGIIVLGGALQLGESARSGQVEFNSAAERMTSLIPLARRYPEAQLVFSGGSGLPFGSTLREADLAARFFTAMGLDPQRLRLERNSRTTWENAVASKALIQPRAGQTWLLLTSSWHMPRAVGCFRRAGWPVLPYPVDHEAHAARAWLHFNAVREFDDLSQATREWIGLLAYHLKGRTDAWFPAPGPATVPSPVSSAPASSTPTPAAAAPGTPSPPAS